MRLSGLVLALALTACESASESWAVVREGELSITVDVRGELEPAASESLGPPTIRHMWEFKITRLAAEGSAVQPGDVIMEFDGSELERQLLEKRAEQSSAKAAIAKERAEIALTEQTDALAIIEAEARLRKAELKLSRPEDLTASLDLALSRLDVELAQKEVAYRRERAAEARAKSQANVAMLESRLRRAEERVAELERDLPRLKITAPRAGTVLHVIGQNRKKKQLGDGVWWGEKVVQIAALDRMVAEGEIDEVDVSRVAVGQPVTFRLEAHPDLECRGTLLAVSETVERKSPQNPLRVVRLSIDVVDTGELRPRPGMRFEGRIETARVRGALIPVEAVIATERGPVARRRRGLRSETVELELGRRDRTELHVLGGLRPGDEVALAASATGGVP